MELSITTDPLHARPRSPISRWMPVFNKLTNLTSLKFSLKNGASSWYGNCALDLPRLESLHICKLGMSDLTLRCPGLRSIMLERCSVKGRLSLEAPLEHLACKGDITLCVHEGFPRSNFVGLRSLRCHLWDARSQLIPDEINGILPSMSMLRTLDLVFNRGGLPPHLPASLQSLSYYLERYWGPNDLERFVDTCRLPHLQSINLIHWNKWRPDDQIVLQELTAEGKGKGKRKGKGKGKGKGKSKGSSKPDSKGKGRVNVIMKNGETFEF